MADLNKSGAAGVSVDQNTPDLVGAISYGVSEHLRLFHDEMHLLSDSEASAQKQYVEQAIAEGNITKLKDLYEEYASEAAREERRKKQELYFRDYLDPLASMKSRGVISEDSYNQWIKWMQDGQRAGYEKTKSIRDTFQAYRNDREELAGDRKELIEEIKKNKAMENLTDSELKAKIEYLTDDKKWFNEHEFTQRKNLIDHIRAGLATDKGGEKIKKLKSEAEKILMDATKEPQPALHRDKVGTWLKRIFEEGPEKGASFEDLRKFVHGMDAKSLGGLIKVWRDIGIQFWTVRADPAFDGVKTEFVNTKGFLWKHYKDRVSYVSVMKQQRDRAKSLRSRAWSLITGASEALDTKGRRRWLNDYVFNGNHTLEELESIINGNLAIRLDAKLNVYHRYDKAKKRAEKLEGLRGMKVLEKGEFLNLHYEKQLAKVDEMEQRIKELEKNSPDFLLIRHSMDRGDWDEAMDLIEEGRKKPDLLSSDSEQLDSMEEYVRQHQKYKSDKVEAIENKGEEAKEIDELIASLPEDLQGIIVALASEGADCVKMFGWGMYNREWCNRRGYLNPEREMNAIRDGKPQALSKFRKQKSKGVVSETIQGETGEEEYIELSRSAATNVCLDIAEAGARSAMIRTVKNRRNDHRAWYWTNIILHQGGNLMSLEKQIMENKKIYKIGKLLKKLERKGESYSFKGTQASLKEKASIVRGKSETSYQTAG